MYDDDSDDEEGKMGKKVTKSVKRVARGTRRMSLMAADNVTKVAAGVQGNVKKVAAGTAGVVGAAGDAVLMKKKKKKKKKKKDKDKKKKKRGRSESPRRSTNGTSKPPVTKPSGFRSFFSPKRWRSASPMIGRSKKVKGGTMDSEDDLEPLAPLPSFQNQVPATPEPAYENGMMYGGAAGGGMQMQMHGAGMPMPGGGMPMNGGGIINGGGTGMNASYHQPRGDTIGMSMRSMSSAQRYQRNQQQEKIEKEYQLPFVSALLQSKHFIKYCDIAFDLVDSNGDDAIDETELYAGLLLIHLKLGSFLGPAACKPLSRERCSTMFKKFDSTCTGGLDRNEFRRVMMVLFGNIFARVVVQYTLTIIIVPLIAKSVLEFLTWDSQSFWDYWTKPKHLRRMGEQFTLKYYIDWNVTSYPSTRRTFFTKFFRFFRLGSDEFWNTFPLTFMTILLGLVIAPAVLHYCDEFFQYAVDWKAKRDKMQLMKKR